MKEKKGQTRVTLAGLALGWSPNQGPIYKQLLDQLIQAIECGRAAPGHRLPSSRQLAEGLGLSRTTTERVISELLAEGYAVSTSRRGVFVAQSPPRATSPPTRHAAKSSSPDPVSFDSIPELEHFPNRQWARSLRRSWLSPSRHLFEGRYTSGDPALKAAIAEWLFQHRGVSVAPEQIVITGGNRDSLTLIAHALQCRAPTARWYVETPCYPPLKRVIENQGHTVYDLPLDDGGLTLPAETHTITLGTPSRHFPLGVMPSRARRQAWVEHLALHDSWLIEDDYDTAFHFEGTPPPCLFRGDPHGRTLLIGSFSKVMFKGLRLAFIVSPISLTQTLVDAQKHLGSTTSLALQPALADFMAQGDFARHLNRMRRHYRRRRDELLALLTHYLADHLVWETPTAGLHVVVYLPASFAEETQALDQRIATALAREGILLDPLSRYSDSSTAQAGFVLGFTHWRDDDAVQVFKRLRQWLEAIEHGPPQQKRPPEGRRQKPIQD